MLNNMGLGFVFTARDLASGTIRNLERNFMGLDQRVGLGAARIQSAFMQLGVGLAVFTAGAAAVGAGLSLANAAGEFEQGLASVGAVTRATTDQLHSLRNAAIQAGVETQFSPAEAVAGLQSLATAGQTAEQATRTLIPVLDLAAGSLGQLGVSQAADALVGTLNAYGVAADQATGVTDKLLRITQLTNFQTRDFEAGLSKAAATGAVFGQDLNDVLITMGLLRNRNIDASSSATAFREAVRRVGSDSRAQQAVTGAGIEIFDEQSNQMRSIVDIMDEFAKATAGMSAEERNRRVVTAFGARGLLAFNSILNASFTTMRDGQEVTLKGTEALAALREEMSGAEGTAARFREKLLDTFEGQKTLLKGSMQTLAIVSGEAFAQFFKPIVSVVIQIVNAVLGAFQALPAPVKKAFAAFVTGAGAVVALVGGIIAAKAAIALLAIGLQAIGVTLGGIVAIVLPAVAIFGLLALTIAGFVVAFRDNVGGISDFFTRFKEQVGLAFKGLMQLFDQGGFSGAVKDELSRAENGGLKDFLISVYTWVARIKNFFSGIASGFSAGVAAAKPSIEAFLNALTGLGKSLGLLSEKDDATTASNKFEAFGKTGERVGKALARAFDFVVQVLTAVTEVAQGVAAGWDYMTPGIDMVKNALSQLGDKLDEAINQLFGSREATDQSGGGWRTLGTVIAFSIGMALGVIGAFVTVISAMVAVVSGVVGAVMASFSGLADVVTGVVFIIGGIINGNWSDIWKGMKLVAFGVVDAVIGVVLELAGAIAGVVDALAGLFGKNTKYQQGIRDFRQSIRTDMADRYGVQDLTFTKPVRAVPQANMTPATEATATMPAAAAMSSNAATPLVVKAPPAPPPPPVNVQLQVDGQTLASVVAKANRDAASRSFSPVPSY
ncbi:MAG: phage tail tape measure protein [Polyangiaceae bacterium]